jgi:hypothetical protein
MNRKGRLLLLLILPDGSKALIPADWTDLASTTKPRSAPTATTLGSLENLLHARAVVDALFGRLAPVTEGGNFATTKESAGARKNPNLFDLLLDESYPWETLDEEQKNRAVQILARLIVQAARLSAEKGKNDE